MSATRSSSKSLPARPSEERLRKEAKRIAKEHEVQLATAQRRLAHEYGHRNWAELMMQVKGGAPAGSSSAGSSADPLQQSGTGPVEANAGNLLPFLPLRGLVALPHMAYPVYVGRPRSIAAIDFAEEHKVPLLLATQKDAQVKDPTTDDMNQIATVGTLLTVVRLPDKTIKVMVEANRRVRVKRFVFDQELFRAEFEAIDEPHASRAATFALLRPLLSAYKQFRQKNKDVQNPNWKQSVTVGFGRGDQPALVEADVISALDSPSIMADKIAAYLPLEVHEKQALLETLDPIQRMAKLLAHLGV